VRIGILSDSHLPGLVRQLDELGPEPGAFFSAVDLILHSGDVTSPTVLDWLEQLLEVVRLDLIFITKTKAQSNYQSFLAWLLLW